MQSVHVPAPAQAESRGLSRLPSDLVPRVTSISVATLLLASIAIRLVALVASTGHGYDHWTMQVWTRALAEHPLSAFYGLDLDVPQDHLPGDLLIFAAIGRALVVLTPGHASGNIPDVQLIKAVAVVADFAIAVLIHVIARRLASPRVALVATAAFLASPGVVYVSSIWGQWDAVSAAFAVGAVALALGGGRGRTLAWPMLAYACLIKPQYVLIAPFLLLLFWKREGMRGLVHSALGSMLGLGVVQAVVVVFDVGLPGVPARWALIERMRAAVEEYDAISLGAHNLWILPIGRGAPLSDQDTLVAGISYQTLGTALFVVAAVAIGCCAARFADPRMALAWGSTATLFAMFVTMTRMHERYLFPVLPLAVVTAVLMPRLRWTVAGVHVAYALNVHLAYTNGDAAPGLLQSDACWRLNALVLIVLFLHVLWVGIRVALGVAAGQHSVAPQFAAADSLQGRVGARSPVP